MTFELQHTDTASEARTGIITTDHGQVKTPIFMPDGTEARICTEIAARQQMGINKYSTTVAENPLSLREWLVHAKQEALDQAIYLQRAIEEIDAKEARRHG